MRNLLPSWLLGSLTFVYLFVNTIVVAPPFYVIAIAKLAVPNASWRERCGAALVRLAEAWIGANNAGVDLLQSIEWDIDVPGGLSREDWYVVASNHQSWVDVLVLQRTFNRRIPFLKFFLKQELIWLPVLGLAWWAMDMPFMKRYSKAVLREHPELRGTDMEATRKACLRFRTQPISVLNFLEGTRFTSEKHRAKKSPHRHLLPPKLGGLAASLDAMGDRFRSLLSVTIVYPEGRRSFWDFLSGRMHRVVVRVEELPIPISLLGGNYGDDPDYRTRLRDWVAEIWNEKDVLIANILEAPGESRAA